MSVKEFPTIKTVSRAEQLERRHPQTPNSYPFGFLPSLNREEKRQSIMQSSYLPKPMSKRSLIISERNRRHNPQVCLKKLIL